MKKLRFALGFLTAMTLAFTPAVSPVGPFVVEAEAATIGSGSCSQTVSRSSPGTVTQSGSNCVVSFTYSGSSFTWTAPPGVTQANYLIVAGGGGGSPSGGGGAGGYRAGTKTGLTNTSYSVTVGSGGSGGSGLGSSASQGENGGNSSIFGIVSTGGGGAGANYHPNNGTLGNGRDGGSGGAAGAATALNVGGSGIPGQGNDGGNTYWSNNPYPGGGGGGAGGDGGDGQANQGGSGGIGKYSSITGSSVGYAGGGAGASYRSDLGSPGAQAAVFGGGAAASTSVDGGNGTNGKGGGGGGAQGGGTGGRGGSGIVILSYSLTPSAPSSASVSSGDASLTVGYTAPTYWGGGGLSIEYELDNSGTWVAFPDTSGSGTISGLSNGTSYEVKLRAKNSFGYASSETSAGTAMPSTVGEILRLDATHPDSYGGSGATWTDLAGSHDGTLTYTSESTYQAREKAFQFDGSDDYVDLPDMAYDFSNGLAIHAVVDFGDAQDWERILDFGNGENDDNIVFGRYSQTTQLVLQVSVDGVGQQSCYSTAGAIAAGMHSYSAIINSEGVCSFVRDGGADLAADGYDTVQLPASVTRQSNFVGKANWSNTNPSRLSLQSLVMYNTAQTIPTCYPIEDQYVGNGTNGTAGLTYSSYQFLTVGSCSWNPPAGISSADVLVVGGGGGGAGNYTSNFLPAGGSGGGGGVYLADDLPVSGVTTITVGRGGSGGVASSTKPLSAGLQGGDSAFGTLTSGGGGGGGIDTENDSWSADSSINGRDGNAAGNGGSPSNFWGATSYGRPGDASSVTISGVTFPAIAGNRGGGYSSANSTTGSAGSGGGAGTNGNYNTPGSGVTSYLTGSATSYGGGGASWNSTSHTFVSPVSGSGQGADGAKANSATNGLNGASGTVVVRYVTAVPVTFDANGGTGSMATQSVSVGTATNLTTNSFSRTGYTFAGWDTVAGGGGTDYTDGQSVTLSNGLELFAQWDLDTITVSYDSNGGSGTMANQSGDYGSSLTLTSNGFSKSDLLFQGWNTSADGSGTRFDEGASLTLSSDQTLYAQWTNLLINLDGSDTDSLPNSATSWSSIFPGSSRAQGSKVDGATYFSEGGIRGFSFDGSYDAVEFAAGTGGVDGAMTMETWVNLGDLKNGWNIIATRWFSNRSGSGASDWHFAIKPEPGDNQYRLNLFTTSTNDVYGEYAFPATSADVWYHLAFTIDGSNNAQFYVNGQADGDSFTANRTRNNSALLWLGDARDGMGFVGDMSAFRIYNKALSASEMSDSFDADKARFGLVELTFDANGGSGSMSPQDVYENVSTSLNSNSFSRSGYLFDGWNTAADGTTGSDYSDGASIVAASDLTLYAKWVPDAYVMTFAPGDNSTGSNQTASKNHGSDFTIPDASTSRGYFSRTGYTLTGWSINSDGSTLDYDFGDVYSTDAAETFYPHWTINTYTLTLNKGTASGAAGSDQTATKTHGVNYALPNSAYANSTFTRAGHTVTGWSTTAAGLAKDYDFGDSFTTNATTTLYPYWTADTYSVTYSAGDDGSGSDVTATKTYGSDLTLRSSVDANGDFTRTHYTVSAWSENSDGSTSDYALGGTYSTNEALTLYPVWTANTYTVTYNYNSATGGNSTATSSYVYDGIVVSLPSPTKTGYTFGGWYSNAGLTVSAGAAGANFTTTGDVTLYAKWTAATFTVVYDYNGATGGNSTTDDDFTTGGTVITLPTPTRTGYTFGGWYSNAGLTSLVGAGGASYSPTSNRTVYAKWTAVTRSVTYHNNGSPLTGSVPVDATSYIIGDTVVVKANTGGLARTGYSFGGWTTTYGSGTAKNAGETITVATADIDLYPKWVAETYTFTYHANGGSGSLARATDTYTTGDANTTLAGVGSLAKTGYTFGGWSTTPTGSDVGATYSSTTDVTLYAVWNIKSITYSYAKGQDGDGNSLSGFSFTAPFPSGSTDDYGTVVTLSSSVDSEIDAQAPSGIDHQFYGWSDGSSVYDAGDTYILGETDPTFTAQWAKVYSVRYSYAGGTAAGSDLTTDAECLGGDNTCTNGQTITLNSRPTRAGYTFLGWQDQSGNLKSAAAQTSISASSYLFAAQWQAISYNMNFNTMGGSNSVSNTTRTIGQLLEMPDPGTKDGYTFAGWSDGSTLYGVGIDYTVGASSKSFAAQWTPDVYTVTYDWQGGTSSTPKVSDSYTFDSGDMSLATASANGYTRDGYTFSGWSETLDGDLVTGFRPSANDVLYAVWADGNYTLSYNPSGGSVGSGTGTVPRTSTITLPTPVRASFTFAGWYDAASGGTKIGDGGASYTPTASETLYARWVQDSLYGVDLATLETANTYTASSATATDTTISHGPSSSSARVQIPAGALPDGTVVTVRYFKDTNRQADLISGENTYFFSLLVSWLYGSGNSATVPDTASGKPITVTLTNSNIRAGAMVYQVIGETVTELARATVDGSVTVELTEDPEVVVAATKPSAPTSVTGTSADSAASVSWTAATSGGAPVTKYTVTASPGGGTCETATTSCSISGLTNNTAYTFSVTATNAIGTSESSSASSAVTPRGTTYAVTFNSNGGSAISAGSFFSGGSVSAPSSPSRSGYTFQGWSTTQDDDSTEVSFPYSPGVLNAITLYALWDVAPASSSSSSRARVVTPVIPATPTLPNLRILPRPTVLIPAPLKAPVIIPSAPPVAGNETSVAVGGRSVASETVQEGDVVKVKTGKIEVGLSVPKPSPTTTVRPNPATASPEVVVGVADVARLDAKGLLPGSSVQVWLPGADGRELARSVVSPDGSIAADIPLTATRDQAPVPIGPQVLQVTGVDEAGNQTVIDMTINVVQGAPAPEFNRVANQLPDLQPGQTLATSAGVPETVTIVGNADTREVSVSSEEWSFTVSLPESHGSVEAETQSSPTIRVVQEKTAEVSGDGFQPNTRVDIFLFSDPTLLGSFTVNADGSFTAEVFMDQRFAVVGDHTLQIQGVGTDGYVKAANLGVLVDEPLAATTSSHALGLLWWAIASFIAVLLLIVVAAALRRGRKLT